MMENGFAEVNGVRLHYVKKGQGRPLIFQHGLGHCWRQWRRQMEDLAGDYQVVALDMPGFNDPDKPEEVEKYRMRSLTTYISGMADHFGFEKFTLVSHNLNGIGWIYGALCTERLDRLVIANAPHPNVMDREWKTNPEQASASFYVPIIQGPDGEQFLSENNYAALRKFMGLDVLRDTGKISAEEYDAMMAVIAREGTIRAWCNYYRATPTRGLNRSEETGKKLQPLMIKAPTLVIWGMDDHALLPGLINGLEEYVPDVTIRRVPGGTHQVVLEEPELVSSYIKEFLAG